MGCHDPFDLSGDRMMEIYKMIEKNHGVVALDVGDILMESHQTTALLRIADRCPDLKVVICHLLAPMREKKKEWKAELQMLTQANVWFDIAAMPKIMAPDVYPYPETADILAEARDIIGADRMMWGTDGEQTLRLLLRRIPMSISRTILRNPTYLHRRSWRIFIITTHSLFTSAE